MPVFSSVLRRIHGHFVFLTVAHVQVESINGVWRVERNLSVSRAIGDAGVCDLLHLPLRLPAVDGLFRVACLLLTAFFALPLRCA